MDGWTYRLRVARHAIEQVVRFRLLSPRDTVWCKQLIGAEAIDSGVADTPATIHRRSTCQLRKRSDLVVHSRLGFWSFPKRVWRSQLVLLLMLTQCASAATTSNAPTLFSRIGNWAMTD